MHAPRPKTVGAFEAKTRLPALLREVAKGKEIVITKRNRPVARLVPVASRDEASNVFDQIRAFRGTIKLAKGETVKDLINEGRRR